MKLVYLANIRMPTEKAHGVQVVKMCEAFAAAGAEVVLVVPTRQNDLQADPHLYYGVQKNFAIQFVPTPDTVKWPLIGFTLQSMLFARAAARALRSQEVDAVFGRDELPLWRVSRMLQKPAVWETHTGAWNTAARRLAREAKKIIAISQGLKDFYVQKGVPADKIVVAHDGVDLSAFANPEAPLTARLRLGLPTNKKVALYIGRLDGWKGVATLLEASKLLQEIKVVVIGGEPAQVSGLEKQYPFVQFVGYRPYSELPHNQQAGDVLVLPNTAKDQVSAHYTSPLKLFAYMASGVPMVASDLPSIREIADESSVVLVKPDDAQALADGIKLALSEGAPRAAVAKELVKSYTWEVRAASILASLKTF